MPQVPYTLVTLESDESVPQRQEWASKPKAWYGWNTKNPALVRPLPIGLNEDSQLVPMQKAQRPKTRKPKMLVNFKLDRPWRKQLWALSEQWPFAERIPYTPLNWHNVDTQVAW